MEQPAPWRALDLPQPETVRVDEGDRPVSSAPRKPLLIAGAGVAFVACIAVIATALLATPAPVILESPGGGASAAAVVAPQLTVEVAGAVLQPGVYELPAGSRVRDAIAAAGGYGPDVDAAAAEVQLNLAAKLSDGQVVRVPRRGDRASPGTSPSSGGVVNLNTASAEELDTLPGIGPVTAAKIVASRQEQPFTSVEDLVTRKLVTASTLDKFRDRVTVS